MALNERRQSDVFDLADAMRLCACPQIDGSLLMMRKNTFFWKSSSFEASMPGGSAVSWPAATDVGAEAAGADCASGGVLAQAGRLMAARRKPPCTTDRRTLAGPMRRLGIETRGFEVNAKLGGAHLPRGPARR